MPRETGVMFTDEGLRVKRPETWFTFMPTLDCELRRW
jgi:hypothetical protein